MSELFTGYPLLNSIIGDATRLLLRVGPMLIAAIFLAELARRWIGDEKLKAILTGKHSITGRIRAALLGAVLPFCECGAFPVMMGLIRAGVPTGAVLTFFLISPVVSMPAFMILISIFNLPFALLYLFITITTGFIGAIILEKAGLKWGIFKPDIALAEKPEITISATACGSTSCCDSPGNCPDNYLTGTAKSVRGSKTANKREMKLAELIISANQAWSHTLKLLKKLAPYMAAVIIVSASLKNLVSPELIRDAITARAPLDILIGALAGIPIYTGDCAMITLVTPLIGATGALGAGIAFIISGAGTSVSGIIFMSSVFKKNFLVLYILTIFCIALIAGFIVSLLPALGLI